MKILSDSNKVIIEANSEKIIFNNIFLNKIINIKDIESMYLFNDIIYVLYNKNRLYKKSLTTMKLSQKEELKEFIEQHIKENIIFYKEDNMSVYIFFYTIWAFIYAFLSDYPLMYRVILIFIILIGMSCWVYDCLHCYITCHFHKKVFVTTRNNGQVKSEVPIEKVKFAGEKMTGDIIYLKFPNKFRKIALPKYISAPRDFSSALGDLYINKNN